MNNATKTVNDSPVRPILRRVAIQCVSNTLLVGLSFYFGFLLTSFLSRTPKMPLIAQGELIMMSLGAAFSYAFVLVFRQEYQNGAAKSSKELFLDSFWNISYAYLLHLTILFLVKDSGFSSVRGSVGLGYLLGYLGILANGFAMSRLFISTSVREGKKRIIFRGMEQSVGSGLLNTSRLFSPVEFHISRDIPRSEIMAHLDRLRGYDLKIVVNDKSENIFSDDEYLVRK